MEVELFFLFEKKKIIIMYTYERCGQFADDTFALGSGLWLRALGWERIITFEVFNDWQKERYRS